jgi:hypothetical protein
MGNCRWLVLCLGLALGLLSGCGAPQAGLKDDLSKTGMAWHSYHDVHQKGPANWDELIAFAKESKLGADAVQRVRDAKYELKWTANLKEARDGMSNVVLAEKAGAGPKLMLDASVK